MTILWRNAADNSDPRGFGAGVLRDEAGIRNAAIHHAHSVRRNSRADGAAGKSRCRDHCDSPELKARGCKGTRVPLDQMIVAMENDWTAELHAYGEDS